MVGNNVFFVIGWNRQEKRIAEGVERNVMALSIL